MRVHRPRLEVVIKKHFELKLRANPLLTLGRYHMIGTWEDLIFLIKLVNFGRLFWPVEVMTPPRKSRSIKWSTKPDDKSWQHL